ncbi:class I SAM-dependent methyltransferase [Chromatocurvus halotolerans]|uniref:Methyltransferase family protein n=1 Tax=Chromatocurvus halotolerans TaxID=1132028 RepID=A0A4R2KIP3_9GAMM|nr:class I SAM-dependent methyltransferase [Chromatocurvus halotolerans]TCO73751.1 methyltransferase family protein [Chromatocurvus halotolerans]
MNDWTAGYRADITYTHGYYPELNPARMALPLLKAGIVPPSVTNACELGFGQGVSINVHAAAGAARWYGTDFNPAQAGYARSLAAAAGSPAALHDEAFEQFCQRDDLPEFDFIALHGIWSWISDTNRQHIVDLLARRLRVGGVLYISYNTQPGWAAFAPLRHLLHAHAETLAAPGRNIEDRIGDAIGFAERLMDTNPAYARANPQIAERLKKLREQNRQYLAHEYFNASWQPMHVDTLADWLAPARLTFACSAHPLDTVDSINLTDDQQQLLRDIPDPLLRESTRDFMVNQQFRRDYWIKGRRELDALTRLEALRDLSVVLVTPADDVPLKVNGALGEATLTESVYAPVLRQLGDHRPRRLGELETSLADHGLNLPQLVEVATILSGAGHLHLVQPDTRATTDSCGKLNRALMKQARGAGSVAHLASPVTGGGLSVGRFAQLFLLAREAGYQTPKDWAHYAWDLLNAQGQRLVRDGAPIESAQDNLAELEAQALTFDEKALPALLALGVAV